MFLTLTCDSYGKVGDDGTPADPDSYDYQRAARDAIHFAALVDRFIQNLRRFLGYDVQYFAAIEPQQRLAPHVHMAIRGTVSRADLRQVLAATYHQVWWPSTDDGALRRRPAPRLARGHPGTTSTRPPGKSCPPGTRPSTPSARRTRRCTWPGSGPKFDAQGVLAGSKDAGRCIRYLTKYLTKHIADCHQADTDAQRDHADRLADALRYEPCSPTCANWLRYGIQPKNAPPGPAAGRVQGQGPPRRAPRLRRAPGPGLPQVVGQDPGRPPRRPQGLAAGHARPARQPEDTAATGGSWSPPADADFMTYGRRLLHVLADRARWQAALAEARRKAARSHRRPSGDREGSVMAARSRPDSNGS